MLDYAMVVAAAGRAGVTSLDEERMREMFKAVDGVLRENPEVGAYNQSI